MEEIIELLTDAWIALSEPVRKWMNKSKEMADRKASAAHVTDRGEKDFFDSFEDIITKQDLHNVTCFFFTPLKIKKRKWMITAIDKQDTICWKIPVVIPDNTMEWAENEYLISNNLS